MPHLSITRARFAFDGADNILEEAHFGIFNGQITVGVNYRDTLAIAGLWAPPYFSADFRLKPLIFLKAGPLPEEMLAGGEIPARDYTWYPAEVGRTGKLGALAISSTTILPKRSRAALLAVTLANSGSEPAEVIFRLSLAGDLQYSEVWWFAVPSVMATVPEEELLVRESRPGAIIIGTDIAGLVWDERRSFWHGQLRLLPGGAKTFHIAVAAGKKAAAVKTCRKIIAAPERVINAARRDFDWQVRDLFARLPSLEADDERLVKIYNRSLVHFLLHKWRVPEFILQPYYGTGSINGGCIGNYLWNFGEGWEIHPLYDPRAVREHIKQFLKINLTRHFCLNPLDGRGLGPWYPVNQEKIIGLAYYYVLNTGDLSLLADAVGDKKVLDLIIAQALVGDDPAKPVALYDYGIAGESHLELRRKIPYHGIMPDLNGRRYLNYLRAYTLSELAGRPEKSLPERAAALKLLLKKELWNREQKWFDFVIDGKRDVRWTIQMFNLINSPVLDDEEEKGLLSHLNEDEFLSEFGLHSLSKNDPAYDPADVDNGGPGACTSFPPQIIEKLYQAGQTALAEDLFRRILWWGEKMPYWGDSITADKIDYRRDTPLQCTIDGIAVAQMIIFGLFGVNVRPDGMISINPHPPAYSRRMKLKGLKLRGLKIDLITDAAGYTARVGEQTVSSALGKSLVFNIQTGSLEKTEK